MKNTLFIAAIALLCTGISSCRKERTCECKTITTTVVQGPGAGTYVTTSSYKDTKAKQKSKDFRLNSNCISESYMEYDNNGPTTSQSTIEKKCELK